MMKYFSKTVCTHSKQANEQTLKTELPIKTKIQMNYNNRKMHAQTGKKVNRSLLNRSKEHRKFCWFFETRQ